MSDLTFDISEYWLEHFVLSFNQLLVIKDVLHFLVFPLLVEQSQFLQLLLVLAEVKDCLWDYNVCINFLL